MSVCYTTSKYQYTWGSLDDKGTERDLEKKSLSAQEFVNFFGAALHCSGEHQEAVDFVRDRMSVYMKTPLESLDELPTPTFTAPFTIETLEEVWKRNEEIDRRDRPMYDGLDDERW